MPSLATLLAHPDQRRPSPPPPQADLRTVVKLGLSLWAAALVVNLVLLMAGHGDAQVVATCLVGLALGAVGMVWALRRPPYDPDADAETGPAPSGTDAPAAPTPPDAPGPPT